MVVIALLPMQQSGKSEGQSNTATQPTEKTLSARQAIAHVKEYFKADSERKTTKTITYTLPIEPKERPYPSGIISLEYGLKPND
jgi:hypothetical protein